MSHITPKSYKALIARLNKAPQGMPESEAAYKILKHLFTEKEARLVSILPIKPFSLTKAAQIWKLSQKESEEVLEGLADKGIIVDLTKEDEKVYAVSPPMAGFIEFSIMKTGGNFNKKLLSELYHQYINQEDEFTKQVFSLYPTFERTYVHEDTIQEKDKDIVLSYEKVTELINKSDFWATGICYCRHKMEHLGKACNHSMQVCMSFNAIGKTLSKHGIAKSITKKEALDIVKKCRDEGLVQIGSNMQNEISWLCNCCGCCCEALIAYKKLGYNPRIETNWYAKNNEPKCTGCSICTKKCPVDAIIIENRKAKIDMNKCIGCGVCTRFCPTKSLTMKRRKETSFVPVDTFERVILQAIDSGKLQNLIFDNYNLWGYGIFRKVLEIIFKLPPAKWILANRQLQSRFLTALGNSMYKKNPAVFNYKKPDYSHPEMNTEYGKPKK